MVRITRVSVVESGSETPGPIPLTHHAILELVAPFTRRGHHLDLPASDRAARRLRFKPTQHANQPLPGENLTSTLILEQPADDHFRLQRLVSDAAGLVSTLEIEGTDPGLLLEQVEAIDVGRQLVVVDGAHVARSYRLQPVAADERQPAHWRLQIERAEARVERVLLSLNAKTGRKMPADFELRADDECRLCVPADLLAVLGWEWRPMRQFGKTWRGSVRVAADEPERTRDIEAKLAQAVPHLEKTLRSHPGEFHARWQSARWRVTFQRAIPVLIGLSLLGTAPLIQLFSLMDVSLVRMFMFQGPPLLMVAILVMRELPVIEIPPMPRRLIGSEWLVDDSKGRIEKPSVQGAEAG